MGLPALDVVFGLAARAVELLVKVFAATAHQIGHDVAGVATHGANLDPGDHAALLRPRAGPVGEGLEPAQFRAFARIASRRGGLQGLHMLAQPRIFRQAEHVTQTMAVAQVQNLRCAVVAVSPQQDVG